MAYDTDEIADVLFGKRKWKTFNSGGGKVRTFMEKIVYKGMVLDVIGSVDSKTGKVTLDEDINEDDYELRTKLGPE